MILTKQCACGQKVEFEAAALPDLNCPRCGLTLADQFKDVTAYQSRTVPSEAGEFSKKAVLETVRRESSYKALRGLIGVVITSGYILVLLFFTEALIVAGRYANVDPYTLPITALLVALLLVIILMAIKEAFFLGIDAVDILIANRADRAENIASRALSTIDK